MLKKEELPDCPVATTVQLIGNKWKLLILRNLRMRPWRFNELQKSLEGISQKVLTESLRSMEADGIIVRNGLCRSSAESGVFPQRTGGNHASDPGCDGTVGQ